MNIMAIFFIVFVELFSMITITFSDTTEETHPPGHLLPLGSHQPPIGGVRTIDFFPTPEEFYHEFVSPSVPVLFKGVGKNMPGYKWTDEYLSNKYGSWSVEVEVGKKENRTWGTYQDTLKSFIESYNEKDSYLVESVPQMMHDEVIIPKCILCGGFTSLLQDIILWFSSGGTKSVLHFDGIDNINCLFSGYKEFFLVDKKEKSKIDIDVPQGAYSAVDVDKVDMYKYPGLSSVPWYKVTMEPGDCLFLPSHWFHQVRSSYSRNLAINLWFAHLLKFNQTDCDKSQILNEDSVTLSNYQVDGQEAVRSQVLQMMDGRALNFQQWLEIFQVHMGLSVQPENEVEVKKGFTQVDADSDGYVTPEELKKLPAAEILAVVPRDGPPLYKDDGNDEEEEEEETMEMNPEDQNVSTENDIDQIVSDEETPSENSLEHEEL